MHQQLPHAPFSPKSVTNMFQFILVTGLTSNFDLEFCFISYYLKVIEGIFDMNANGPATVLGLI